MTWINCTIFLISSWLSGFKHCRNTDVYFRLEKKQDFDSLHDVLVYKKALSCVTQKKSYQRRTWGGKELLTLGVRRGWHDFFSMPVAVSLNSVLLENVWTWGLVPKNAPSFSNHCLRKPWPSCQYVTHSIHSAPKLRPEGHFLRFTEQDAKDLVENLKRYRILAISCLFLLVYNLQSLAPWLSQHTFS